MTFGADHLSVVIPTRKRVDILRGTLAALADQTVRGFEVVVVFDGLDQPVPDLPGVRVLQQDHAGPGVARNLAVGEIDRPLVLFLGDDMMPRPDFVARHLARHRSHADPEVAVLGRIFWHPSVPRDRLHSWLDWSGALFDYALLERQGWEDAGWPRFYSSNVSLKRRLFLETGGFDPDFVFDYEDLDFAYRAGQRGLRLLYEPAAVTEHLHPYDWSRVLRRYESHAGAERLMAAKHDWFKPWFHGHIERACSEPSTSRLWALLVDRVPQRPARVRRAVEYRANTYYLQKLAPTFRAAWERAGAEDPAGATRTGQ